MIYVIGLIFFSGLWFFQHRLYKKKLGHKDQQIAELLRSKETLTHQLKVKDNEFAQKRDGYFQDISKAFQNGGEIIQATTTNFKSTETLFLKNVESCEDISQAAQAVSESTHKSQDSLETLKKNSACLKDITSDHEKIMKMLTMVQEKCKKINDIAMQAHLLSFNAAIEAAQAGEHGKGFSVVAEDIATMASVSKASSDEITETVNESLELMHKISTHVENNVDQTVTSTDLVIKEFESVNHHIDGVLKTINHVTNHANQSREEINNMGSESKTELESLNKILSDVIGAVTEREIVDLAPLECSKKLNEFFVVDVRGYDEWNDELGHIAQARHICLQDRFKEQLSALDPKQKYLFVCRSGGRSARGARIAMALGFENVFNMDGGMLRWKEDGLDSVWDEKVA
jgi:methyl-accepting chemotaxis protein